MDQDGRMDLVVTNRGTGNISIFYQVRTRHETGGEAQFLNDPQAHVLGGPNVTGSPRSLRVSDFDGDGDLDITLSTAKNTLATFFNASPDRFTPSVTPLGQDGVSTRAIATAAGDFDGDGDLDVVSANHGGPNLTVFEQLSLRSFFLDVDRSFGDGQDGTVSDPLFANPSDVEAADMDGDGRIDIVAAGYGSTNNAATSEGAGLVLFHQVTTGVFDADSEATVLQDDEILGILDIDVADLNGDGLFDLVAAGRVSDSVAIWLQQPDRTFVSDADVITAPAGGANINNASHVVAVDIDRDPEGTVDLVVAGTSGISILFGDGSGTAASFSGGSSGTLVAQGAAGRPKDLAVLDVDGDGLLDIVSVRYDQSETDALLAKVPDESTGSVVVWIQESAGNFDFLQLTLDPHPEGGLPTSLATMDVDRDGDPDLLVGHRTMNDPDGDYVAVYRQTGTGEFVPDPEVIRDTGGNVATMLDLDAVDVDGDGDLDLAGANVGSHNVTLWFGAY